MTHPIEDKQFIAVKAFIVHDGKVLVLRESEKNPNGTNPHRYDIPGGRLERGEDVTTALHREVKEETGLEVDIGAPLYVGEWWPKVQNEQWHIIGVYFLCHLRGESNVTVNHEHDRAVWINPAEYSTLDLIRNVEPVFQAYLKLSASKP